MTEPSDGAESRQRPAELRIHGRDLLIAGVMPLGRQASPMPTSREQFDAMLDAAIERRAAQGDPIGGGRRLFLIHLKDLIRTHGFPLPEPLKLEACSMPYLFQELNYDDYDWSTKRSELGHLADMVDVDVIVWSDGRSRNELTDAEYDAYFNFCLKAIDYRSQPRENPTGEPHA